MRSLELSFHEAIRAGDSAARLIYADWLEDHDREAEAALLRSGRWCLVPAGSFWMGGGGGEPSKEQVFIPRAFYLGAYPLTQGEWQAVMGNNPSRFSRVSQGKDEVKSINDADLMLFPVECVSWDDIQVFLGKLNAQENWRKLGCRLPTEAEWEYACRGAASSREECSYHFYFDTPSGGQANFSGVPFGNGTEGIGLKRTSKAGSYRPNRLGIHDIHGNVWEWTHSLEGSERIVRGGSWGSNGEYCRVAHRSSYRPSRKSRKVGLRLAVVPSM